VTADTATAEIDAEALAAKVAILQARDADELAGRQRTRARLRQWGERIPPALSPERDVEILAERHGDAWLAAATEFALAVDPGLVARGLHIVGYDQLGIDSPTGSGFVYPAGLFEVVRHRLPAGARPGHIVAINVPAHAAAVADYIDDGPEAALADAVSVSMIATVLHEIAHLAASDAAGRKLPAGIDYQTFQQAAAAPAGDQGPNHGPDWIRAFFHAIHRADLLRREFFWYRMFREDVAPWARVNPGPLADALEVEVGDVATPLAEILRRPAPAAFEELTRDPAADAA